MIFKLPDILTVDFNLAYLETKLTGPFFLLKFASSPLVD
jgi:hypothetical protein